MPKYEIGKFYKGHNDRSFFVSESYGDIAVCSVAVKLCIQKGITRDNGQTPEETIEKFLEERCGVVFDDEANS